MFLLRAGVSAPPAALFLSLQASLLAGKSTPVLPSVSTGASLLPPGHPTLRPAHPLHDGQGLPDIHRHQAKQGSVSSIKY